MTVSVNDVLFSEHRFSGLEKVTVTKITPTGNIRVSDGSLLSPSLDKKTSDTWNTTQYHEWSQELEDKYKLQTLQQELKMRLEKLNVSELNQEALEVLLGALDKH